MKNKINSRIIINEPPSSGSGGGGGGGGTVTTVTIDITATAGTINLVGLSDELIVNLTSSGATESIFGFSNDGNVTKMTLRPASGLTVTASDTIYSGTGNIRLYAAELPIDGTNNGFLELTKRAAQWHETNYVDQYNS